MATKIVTKNSSTAASVPTAAQLVQGELAVNVADKRLFTEDNSGTVVELGTNPSTLDVSGEIVATGGIKITETAGGNFLKFDVDGTADEATVGMDATDLIISVDPTNARANSDFIIKNDGTETFRIASNGVATFAGEITANGGIALGDNDKATFGAGDDLAIYHDGSNSYIDEVGTGDLLIRGGADIKLQNSVGSRTYATFTNSGDAQIYHNNALKLATTATGIDVTGVITTDGITSSAPMTITTADNAAQITLISTDADASVGPLIDLTRDSASPAADDTLGRIRFRGEDANGAITAYAQITGQISSTSAGAVDGQVQFQTMRGGVQKLSLNLNATEAVFNESSEDYDFRVESDGNTHALFVEGSSGDVGIGIADPTQRLHIADVGSCVVIIEGSNDGGSYVNFADADDANVGQIEYDHTSNYMGFRVNDSERMRIDSSGHAIIPAGVTLGTAIDGYDANNTLDDYEEGDFTPVIADAASGGNVASGYGNQRGFYTKVGRLVTCAFDLTNIATVGMTGTNSIYLRDLPFTAASHAGAVQFTAPVIGGGTMTSALSLYAALQDNGSAVRLITSNQTSVSEFLNVSNINSGATDLRFSITYFAA